MTIEQVVVTTLGVGLIGLIYWFFFGKREQEVVASGAVSITVDGGYKPASIKVKKGQTTVLKITRKDPNSCLEEIILPDFKIKKYLPLGQEVKITIKPEIAGEFGFHCGMNMYHGKITVE